MTGATDNPATHATDLLLGSGAWSIDLQHSEVGFAVRALGGLMTVRGVFDSFDGELRPGAGTGAGRLRIEAGSLNTRNSRRDRHLRSPDFLDVERHPRIVFAASATVALEGGLAFTGDLAIRGSRVPLQLPIAVERLGDGGLRIESAAVVSRRAVGMTWNWLGIVADDVSVHARLTLRR
jgi:polyisoprenoid-binding protein YceI